VSLVSDRRKEIDCRLKFSSFHLLNIAEIDISDRYDHGGT